MYYFKKIFHMKYWLIKTEPQTWSWTQQEFFKSTHWDGVRNYQANNYMKQMHVGDLCLFYHSGKERQIMGIVQVSKLYYRDPFDLSGQFGMVDVQIIRALKQPIPLKIIKQQSQLQHLALIRQSRLSVMPVDAQAWNLILSLEH